MFAGISSSRPRARTAPSGYEKLRTPFHIIRTAQLLSSLIVGGIMLFFIWHLTHDHWATPWTFIVLTAVSLLTISTLTLTILLHLLHGLSPSLNLLLNTTLTALWAMGFAMLTWWMSTTLSHACSLANWDSETGILVCRIYKTLFTFSLLGFLATSAALVLDVLIWRAARRGGRHVRLEDLDRKAVAGRGRGPYADVDEDWRESEEGQDDGVPGGRGFGVQFDSRRAQGLGYEVPEAQFEYDTGYRGGHAERVFGEGAS